MKVIFCSFQEADRHIVARIKGRAMNSRYNKLSFRTRDLLKRWDTEDDSVIRQAITKNINGTSRTIVFVGDKTSNSYWVKKEVEMTLANRKPVFAIELPNRSFFSFNPSFLIDNGIVIHPWSEENLQELATQKIIKAELKKSNSIFDFL